MVNATPEPAATVEPQVSPPAAIVVHVGASVVPAEVRTCHTVPFASISVVFADD